MVSKIEGYAPDLGLLLLIMLLFFLALRSAKKRRPVFEEIPMLPYGGALPAIDVDTGELPAMAPLGVPTSPPAGSPVTARGRRLHKHQPRRGRPADAVLVAGALGQVGIVTR